MKHSLTVREGHSLRTIEIESGELLFDALAGLEDSRLGPCGGKGLCGKCRIKRLSGSLSAPDERETALLSRAELDAGMRLACLALAEGDAEIELPEVGAASIIAAGPAARVEPDPYIRVLVVAPRASSLENQADDEARLLAALAEDSVRRGAADPAPRGVTLAALPGLAASCRGAEPGTAPADSPIAAVVADGRVIGVSCARPDRRALGIGLDLGTTTLVAVLIDLDSGERLGFRSELNAQAAFGADVISRIEASSRPEGLATLTSRVRAQIAAMAATLVATVGSAPEDFVCIAVAGNSTMLHFLAGVSPEAIARSPFTPAFLGRRVESAAELGLAAHSGCAAILLPGLSAYVGADIVAGMAAIGLQDAEGQSLFLDLGTNGEIALGGRDGILCCAAAAGPAFEGAGIENGSGGVAGAIDSVWLEGGSLRYGVIGGELAATGICGPATSGICGTGLVDALAAFLDCHLIDYTGRMTDVADARALPPAIAGLVEDGPRGPRVYLDRELRVYLSQADIRAAQLAVAAIAAGIDILLRLAGISPADVARLYLAGGFGSLLNVRSAARIGLFPMELADRAVAVGNTSAAGAAAACLSRRRLEDCDRVRQVSTYVELSSRPDFNAAFVERMTFPEEM